MLAEPLVWNTSIAARDLTGRDQQKNVCGVRELLDALEFTAGRLPSTPEKPKELPRLLLLSRLLDAAFIGHVEIAVSDAIVEPPDDRQDLVAAIEEGACQLFDTAFRRNANNAGL